MFPKINPTTTSAWQLLQDHYEKVKDTRLTDLFVHDKNRFTTFSLTHSDFLFDYSKNNITAETKDLLIRLANECGLSDAISDMFSGKIINETEGRAVLHTALRNLDSTELYVDDKNIMTDIHRVLAQMKDVCNRLHSGEWKGYSGKKIKNIVNIGIGGSHLGPSMIAEALKPFWQPGIQAFFISNIDAADLMETLKKAEADETIFIISSKTFTTQETMTNAESAREWFLQNGGCDDDIAKHFIAISTNTEAVVQFGIAKENMFEFWDWVGGRYSVWSAIGLSVAATIGFEHFESLLRGAHDTDVHFRDTPFEKNIPVMMALIGIWTRNFHGASTEAILPYNQLLSRLPAYLQQANMESNGKSIDRNGNRVTYQTGPIIWGEPGTNGQHAFYQLIHQGTELTPCDFIACAQSHYELEDHHKKLMSNFFAQTEALMNGADSKDPHRKFGGNKPTNSILITQLNPFTLGQLIAMYEQKIFVQGVIWNIFSFDQFGVELGKVLANNILPELEGNDQINSHDSSTNGLINTFKNMRM